MDGSKKDYYREYCGKVSRLPELVPDDEVEERWIELTEDSDREREKWQDAGFDSAADAKAYIINKKFDMGVVVEALAEIPQLIHKLEVLYHLETDYRRQLLEIEHEREEKAARPRGMWFDSTITVQKLKKSFFDFGDLVKMEIQKYKEILQHQKDQIELDRAGFRNDDVPGLDGGGQSVTGRPDDEVPASESVGPPGKLDGLNREVHVLFLYYLCRGLKKKRPNTKQAEVIHLLTGYSKRQLGNLFTWIEDEIVDAADENKGPSNKFRKDIEYVHRCFSLLQLDDICALIDRDLEG